MDDATFPSQARPESTPPAMGKILIVDDNEEGGIALVETFSAMADVGVWLVSSALEAVRILQDQDRSICAVVTDIRMPRMDGFELIQFIRRHQRHAALPIIVVTGDTDPDTPERTLRLGADACFLKPFSARAVRQTLEGLLHANRSSQ